MIDYCAVKKTTKHCIIIFLLKILTQDMCNEALLCTWITGLGSQKK